MSKVKVVELSDETEHDAHEGAAASEDTEKKHVLLRDRNFQPRGYWPLAGDAAEKKLHKAGLNVDTWPAGSEHPMPEQYSDEKPWELNFYKHFFDTGSKLEGVGVNTKQGPLGADHVKGDDKPFKKAGVSLYSWPWDS